MRVNIYSQARCPYLNPFGACKNTACWFLSTGICNWASQNFTYTTTDTSKEQEQKR